MYLRDYDALVVMNADRACCPICQQGAANRSYGKVEHVEHVDSNVCGTCGKKLCFECEQCHEAACPHSKPLQETCWVGLVD